MIKLKQEKYIYIFFLILCIGLALRVHISAISEWNKYDKLMNTLYEEHCIKHQDYDKEGCNNYLKIINRPKADTYYIYFSSFAETTDVFPYLTVLLVSVPVIIILHKKIKKGRLKYILQRIKYETFIKKSYLNSMAYTLMVPISLLILLILSYTYSGHFDLSITKRLVDNSMTEYMHHGSEIYFMLIYFINIIIQSAFYVNLSYIYTLKSKNTLLTIIEVFMTFLGTEIILNLIASKSKYNLGLMNIWTMIGVDYYMLIPTIINIILFVITFVIFFKLYKNKESVLMLND